MLPSGTVTFLFTDIEGSTKLLQGLGEGYGDVLAEHHRLLRDVWTKMDGIEVSTDGDAFFVAFASARQAVLATIAAQRALLEHDWGGRGEVKVRMGLHTGEARLIGDNYGGIDVHRAARIADAGHGGQVLVSEPTRTLVAPSLPEIRFKDLGAHRLKDLADPERLFQICVDGLPTDFPPPRTIDTTPNNLPARLTQFIARDREVTEIAALLHEHRLVTLTGPGGTGKTRLSIEVASQLLGDFPDGAFFVALAAMFDSDLVPGAIADVIDVRAQGTRTVAEGVRSHLSGKQMLLVLDNFEQILDAAPFVSELLSAAPRVKVLVTSRAALRIYGEHEFPVPPMEVLDPEHLPSLDVVASTEAVALFIQRARSIKPAFELTEENAAVVTEICRRLDGLPLAIELAAARIRVLSPADILKRLDRALTLLTSGARDLPDRQRTLREAIAWSYDLLDEPMRAFFRRLSVFAGGWTFEAVEAIVDPDGELGLDPFDGLETLVESSLCRRFDTEKGETRFRMLQTIREFAWEECRGAGEAADVEARHAAYFCERAETLGPMVTTDRDAIDTLATEHDNLRRSLRWTIDIRRPDLGLRTAGALWRFWQVRGHLGEARMWLSELLALPGERDAVRAKGNIAAGSVAYWQLDYDACGRFYQEAVDIYRELDDTEGIAEALYNLAFVSLLAQELDTAKEVYEESRQLFTELGNDHGVANALWGLGMVELLRGDALVAERLALEAQPLYERAGDWFGGQLVRYILYQSARLQGDLERARKMMIEELDLYDAENDLVFTTSVFDCVADVEFARGYPERAVRLVGWSEATKRKTSGESPPVLLLRLGDIRELARELLTEEQIETAWNEGAAMSIHEAFAYIRKDAEVG